MSTTTTSTSSESATPVYYMILPKDDASWDSILAFTERLKNETDPKTLVVGGLIPRMKFFGSWGQMLTPTQAAVYSEDPVVSPERARHRVDSDTSRYHLSLRRILSQVAAWIM